MGSFVYYARPMQSSANCFHFSLIVSFMEYFSACYTFTIVRSSGVDPFGPRAQAPPRIRIERLAQESLGPNNVHRSFISFSLPGAR